MSKLQQISNYKNAIRVSIKTPLLESINDSIAQRETKLKKSEWICEAIVLLNQLENCKELVEEYWDDLGDTKLVYVTLSHSAKRDLSKLMTQIKKGEPKEAKVIKAIVTTAIIQKLISENRLLS